MSFIEFMRSTPGRFVRVVLGVGLILYGALKASVLGLVLMMIGIVPAVTGIAGVCLFDAFVRGHQGARHV